MEKRLRHRRKKHLRHQVSFKLRLSYHNERLFDPRLRLTANINKIKKTENTAQMPGDFVRLTEILCMVDVHIMTSSTCMTWHLTRSRLTFVAYSCTARHGDNGSLQMLRGKTQSIQTTCD